MLDLESLLTPVSAAEPAGRNTEYAGLGDLDRLAQGEPGKADPKSGEIVDAVPADWRKVRAAALELSRQTRDLRVAILLARAELELDGLPGLGQALELVRRLLADFWDTLWPRLDPDEDNDPIERLNALANLDDPAGVLQALRRTPVVESRQAGRFTVRDLDLATGRLAPPEGQEAPSLALLQAAWTSGDADRHAAWRQGVEQGLQALAGIEQLMRERAGQLPRVDTLKKTLRQVQEFYAARAAAQAPDEDAAAAGDEAGADAGVEGGESAGTAASGAAAAPARSGTLATRADAVRLLEQVAEFVRRIEPSSPAPMFIDRAVRVMQMSFADIVKELMPDSKERIELLGGISLDPPSDNDGGY